ncbi:hypothetical protein TWF694_004855 [Orbilia ellipsospora]|uniref:Mis12-Mtw1 family protein n=1 Tax=Orbilia ellipsospora TaxID=2528407 RepID=A0AAV9WU40_9PEZI
MTEFAAYPLPFTFMPMPAIAMASHRPKRKSGARAYGEAGTDGSREASPPLKKTRRSLPDEPPAQPLNPIAKTRTRSQATHSAVETAKDEGSIFSKGPSRAKRARQGQKQREEQQRKEKEASAKEQAPIDSAAVESTKRRSTTLPQQHLTGVSDPTWAQSSENERPLPAQTNLRKAGPGRKSKVQTFETPRKAVSRIRRSPRLNASVVEVSTEANAGSDRSLTVPLAAIEDTPLVRRRNKEMREAKGHRRSSLGLRGRRASSLSNGFIAAPHPDVQPRDFFKHLDAEMIETQRMQQLLAWCSKCALSEKRAKGRDAQSNARAAARVIEEDILADLTEKKLNVNWWESSEDSQNTNDVPKKPHPKNEDHQRKIETLERQLNELNREKQSWESICEKGPTKLQRPQREGGLRPGNLEVSLLRSQDASVLSTFEETDTALSRIQDAISKSRGNIEFKVDQFSHGMHRAHQYSRYAKEASEKVLGKASSVLDIRNEAARKAAGTTALPLHEVLKSISHLDRG